MRANTNISTKNIKQAGISGFSGVDFATSPLKTQANRSVNAVNWIRRDGENQKRYGWEQILQLPSVSSKEVLGATPCTYSGTEYLVVFTRNYLLLYYLDDGGAIISFTNHYKPISVASSTKQIQGYEKDGFVYFFTGNKYYAYSLASKKLCEVNGYASVWDNAKTVYEKSKSGAVYDSQSNSYIHPYVPTTTISIDADSVQDTVRASLDPVNLLTPWRINTMVGNVANSVYILDGEGTAGTDKIYVLIEKSDGTFLHLTSSHIVNTDTANLVDSGGTVYGTVSVTATAVNDILMTVLGEGSVGEIKITLSADYSPAVENADNIKVCYYAMIRDESGSEFQSDLPKARFGTMFGIGGHFDRLFVSGSSTLKNRVWFSEADNFKYFPDTYTADIGTDTRAVVGFLPLSDESLAVFKEQSYNEPAVAYMTGEYRYTYDDSGNVKRMTPVFSITSGSSEESPVNPYTCADLNGDKIFCSKNGVFAVTTSNNVVVNERVLRCRSLAVNPKLSTESGISEARGFVFDNKYFLSVNGDDGYHIYIADAMQKYQPSDYDDVNYEWYLWDNVPANTWFVWDDELWFGTTDGRLCKFPKVWKADGIDATNGEYDQTRRHRDIKFVYVPFGSGNITLAMSIAEETLGKLGFTIYYSDDRVKDALANANLAVYYGGRKYEMVDYINQGSDAGSFNLKTVPTVYGEESEYVYATYSSDEVVTHDLPENPSEYIEVEDFADLPVVGDATKAYYVNTDALFYKWNAEDSTYEEMSFFPSTGDITKVYYATMEDKYYLWTASVETIMDDSPTMVYRELSYNPIDDQCPLNTSVNSGGTGDGFGIVYSDNVVCEWFTPTFDFGTVDATKYLLRLTFSLEYGLDTATTFGYDTKRHSKTYAMQGQQRFEQFDWLTFSNYTVNTGGRDSYTMRAGEKFQFIRFFFRSDTDTNCVVNGMTITYRINQQHIGVR